MDERLEKDHKSPEVQSEQDVNTGEILRVEPNYRKQLRYNSPLVQVLITSLVAFGCPGMFNSLSGIGGGGQVDTSVAATGNIALYAVNAGMYLFVAPIVYHYVGPRWCMFVGGMAYPLYGGSLLAYNHIQSGGFVIAAAAILGVGSAHLWVGQGAVMTGAPLPREKGKMVGIYWFVFNMGGVIGSFIEMGINFDSVKSSVSDATYAVFIALMGAGFLCALLLLSPGRIIRTDGSHVPEEAGRPNVVRDFINIVKILPRKETIVLIPFFILSNYCYSYQQNTVNARMFDIRTRGFNGAFYWFGAFASPLFGWFLDNKKLTRRRTGIYGYILLVLFSFAIFGGGLAFQLRTPSNASDKGEHMYMPSELDMIRSKAKFAGPFLLYFGYGIFDSLWQTFAYWLVGIVGVSDELSARYVGLYKSMQSVGAAVAWKINAASVDYEVEFALNWGLVGLALIVLAPFFWWMKEPPSTLDEEGITVAVDNMPSVYPIKS